MHILIIKVVHSIGDTAFWRQLFIVMGIRKAAYASQKLVANTYFT